MKIYTVGTGVAIGQACMLLSAGHKGKRFMTPHATAMLHQPKIPSTGERQATEVQIKWKEVKAQKEVLVGILSETTGRSVSKVEQVNFKQNSKFLWCIQSFPRIFNGRCI